MWKRGEIRKGTRWENENNLDFGLDYHPDIIYSLHLKHKFDRTDSLGGEATIWVFSVKQIRALSQRTHTVPMECGHLYQPQIHNKEALWCRTKAKTVTLAIRFDELRLSPGTLGSLVYSLQNNDWTNSRHRDCQVRIGLTRSKQKTIPIWAHICSDLAAPSYRAWYFFCPKIEICFYEF